MWLKGGKFVWVNPANGATYTEELHDMTESKIKAAEARAVAALGVSNISLKSHGRDIDPRKGNK